MIYRVRTQSIARLTRPARDLDDLRRSPSVRYADRGDAGLAATTETPRPPSVETQFR